MVKIIQEVPDNVLELFAKLEAHGYLHEYEFTLLRLYFKKRNVLVHYGKYDSIRVIVEANGEKYYGANDVVKFLGYKNNPVKRMFADRGSIRKTFIQVWATSVRFKDISCITEDELLELLQRSRSVKGEKIQELKNLLVSQELLADKLIVERSKERCFTDLLVSTLEPLELTIILQYRVLNFRIDCYIEELNVAIEYDENQHKHYTEEMQAIRQKKIEQEIGCEFIRLTDNKSHPYNVGVVFKAILSRELSKNQ